MQFCSSGDKIPCFLIEEHHEAFYIWHYAIDRKIIPQYKNTLLHVDEHADLGVPQLRTSLKKLHRNLSQIKEFTYQELQISNFIYPALYQGIFNSFYWLRSLHDQDCVPRQLYICSHQNEGKILKVKSYLDFWDYLQSYREIAFFPITSQDRKFPDRGQVILDIDLDYFSCDNTAGAYFEVEITADAYAQLCTDRYHKARLVLGNLLTLKEKNNKYFLCTDREDFPQENLRLSALEIEERIASFCLFLKENYIKPVMISVCRSRFSGYTPTDQWQEIEEQLLVQLQLLYPLHICVPEAW